jgi:hypothetical protein
MKATRPQWAKENLRALATDSRFNALRIERDRIHKLLNPQTEEDAHDLIMSYDQMFLKGKLEVLDEVVVILDMNEDEKTDGND